MIISGVLTVLSWTLWLWQRWIPVRYMPLIVAIVPVVSVGAPMLALLLFLRFEAIQVFTMRIWFYSVLVILSIMVALRLRPLKKQVAEKNKEDDRYIRYDQYLPGSRRRS
jgi:biotin transporter BioY